MSTIVTLPLSAPLSGPAPAHAPEAASAAAVATELIRDPIPWLDRAAFDHDARWAERIGVHRGHEVWLLSWLPGQESPLHDHGGASGAFGVLAGELDEHVVRDDVLLGHRVGPGQIRAFPRDHIHRVGNDGVIPAISLHVYSPALSTMARYEASPAGLRITEVHHAGRDW